MKLRTLSIILIAILVCVALLTTIIPKLWYETKPELQIPTVIAQARDFRVTIDAIGKLDAARSHTISSTIRGDKGKIIYIIPNGTRVEKDEVLIRLDPTPFEEEMHLLNGKVKSFEAAYRSALQMLELEKNNIEQAIRTAEYNIKVAKLELTQLVDGSGPIQLAQFNDDLGKSKEEYFRYKSYVSELKELQQENDQDNASEMYLAVKKMNELKEKYDSAKQKQSSYKKHVLPTSIETNKAKVEKYEMEYKQTQQGGIYKIAKATAGSNEIKAKLETTRALYQLSKQELDKTVIIAPFSGIAILSEIYRQGQKRKPRIGDRVLQNQPLLYFPDVSTMIVQTKIREIDLYKVKKGLPCTILADAYPGAEYQGTIKAIGAMATERREGGGGEKFFDLTVILSNKDTRLRPGMTARVSILVDERHNVITVPIQTVFQERNTSPFCYLQKNAKFIRTPLSLGIGNSDYIEILSGVSHGDVLSAIKPPEKFLTQE